MGGGGDSTQDNTIKYSPYLEAIHSSIINHGGADWARLSVVAAFNACLNQSPYTDWDGFTADEVFGVLENCPTLLDMFGKFMAGLDIDYLWRQLFNDSVDSTQVDAAVTAQSTYLQDEIDSNVMPKVLAGYRDINAVMGSAFIAATAIVADTKLKTLSKYRADLNLKMIDIAHERWKIHLDWNNKVVATYAEIVKLYVSGRMDIDTMTLDFQTKDKLWNLKLFEYVRAMLGAMQGAATTPGLSEPSQVQKSVSGALAGAAMGAQIGGSSGYGGYGAVIGGAIGLGASFF